MITVAGHITVEPQQRESYLSASVADYDVDGARPFFEKGTA